MNVGLVIPRAFYDRDPRRVARELLGRLLVRSLGSETLVARIVETEAYLDRNDSACHAARGLKPKNAPMFGPPGMAYVYPIHAKWCFNVVTLREGRASAVLIRAVAPLAGVDMMRRLRGAAPDAHDHELARGPSRLCQALAIDRKQNRLDLTLGQSLWIADDGVDYRPREIGRSPRIGVTSAADLLLRWFVVDHPAVSGLKRWHREYGA